MDEIPMTPELQPVCRFDVPAANDLPRPCPPMKPRSPGSRRRPFALVALAILAVAAIVSGAGFAAQRAGRRSSRSAAALKPTRRRSRRNWAAAFSKSAFARATPSRLATSLPSSTMNRCGRAKIRRKRRWSRRKRAHERRATRSPCSSSRCGSRSCRPNNRKSTRPAGSARPRPTWRRREAQLAQQQASYQLALFDKDAYTKLPESGAVSQRQAKLAVSTADQQAAAVIAAQRRVEAAQGALMTAKANLSNPDYPRGGVRHGPPATRAAGGGSVQRPRANRAGPGPAGRGAGEPHRSDDSRAVRRHDRDAVRRTGRDRRPAPPS